MVHSYEDGMPPGSHKTRLTALNVYLFTSSSCIYFAFVEEDVRLMPFVLLSHSNFSKIDFAYAS